jgi:hypothetical protein
MPTMDSTMRKHAGERPSSQSSGCTVEVEEFDDLVYVPQFHIPRVLANCAQIHKPQAKVE